MEPVDTTGESHVTPSKEVIESSVESTDIVKAAEPTDVAINLVSNDEIMSELTKETPATGKP